MSEADWQRRVTDYCTVLRLLWYHVPDSRRTNPGFPDLVIAGPGGVLFVELKTERGKVSAHQQTWIDTLEPHVQTRVWRPSQWDEVYDTLLALAGR